MNRLRRRCIETGVMFILVGASTLAYYGPRALDANAAISVNGSAVYEYKLKGQVAEVCLAVFCMGTVLVGLSVKPTWQRIDGAMRRTRRQKYETSARKANVRIGAWEGVRRYWWFLVPCAIFGFLAQAAFSYGEGSVEIGIVVGSLIAAFVCGYIPVLKGKVKIEFMYIVGLLLIVGISAAGFVGWLLGG